MKLGSRDSGTLLVALGLVVQGLALATTELDTLPRKLVGVLAGALLVGGTTLVAKSKGYSPWLGFAGLFSYLGAGLVLLLPARGLVRFRLPTAPAEEAGR